MLRSGDISINNVREHPWCVLFEMDIGGLAAEKHPHDAAHVVTLLGVHDSSAFLIKIAAQSHACKEYCKNWKEKYEFWSHGKWFLRISRGIC